jgi:hypothetical protein
MDRRTPGLMASINQPRRPTMTVESYQNVVTGSGAGENALAWTLGEGRAKDRGRRAALDRRGLPECELSSWQERSPQRQKWPI